MTDYTITYAPVTILNEDGHTYNVFHRSRCIASGWSRGKQRDAEQEARAAIARLEKRAA